ncbi:MAG: L,D-transpeptidase [Sulfitobacter sp.]|nr:L,D-transpeptidase [Sulfitobacter sp.]
MPFITRRDVLLTGAAACVVNPAYATTQNYQIPAQHQARIVQIKAKFAPNEIHVDPGRFALYWTLAGGRAIRYPVGIGTVGRYVSGTFYIHHRRDWPSWTPTKAMIAREPHIYAKHAGGMPGGPDNPLGARALYLYKGNRDSLLRIHGTPRPESVGRRISNGCLRMINAHVIDLSNRAPNGTRVVLH